MAFTLPDLPYSHDALAESGMSAETMEYTRIMMTAMLMMTATATAATDDNGDGNATATATQRQ